MPAKKTPSRPARKKTPKDADKKAAPWDKDNPKGDGEHHHLSDKAKAAAKRSAKKAGRPYPNLVDNMNAAKAEKG